jgi:hypothetical protein
VLLAYGTTDALTVTAGRDARRMGTAAVLLVVAAYECILRLRLIPLSGAIAVAITAEMTPVPPDFRRGTGPLHRGGQGRPVIIHSTPIWLLAGGDGPDRISHLPAIGCCG